MYETIGFLVFTVVAVTAVYWCGRIDGYWIRAAEDRGRDRNPEGSAP